MEQEFKEDVRVSLNEQIEFARKIQRAVEIEEIKESVFIPSIVPIPYTPPVTLWKPSGTSKRAFAYQCIKALLP